MDFNPLEEQLRAIQAEWDGKDKGEKEERAEIAEDALTKVAELETLLAELGL